MMNQYPKKFIYSGIEFDTNNSNMKNISNALQGRNIMASNLD